MDSVPNLFTKGDWIVHAYYGVGQVKGMEKKQLEGEKKLFYKVKTSNGAYWLSVLRADAEYIRPITSERQIRRALTEMRRPPKPLPENNLRRNKAINQTLTDTALYPKARMIRDLHGKQVVSRLSIKEEDALSKLKEQFVSEWAVVARSERSLLEEKLETALAASIEKSLA